MNGSTTPIATIYRRDLPVSLREIPEPPVRLFVRGNAALITDGANIDEPTSTTNPSIYSANEPTNTKYLCVVGSRRASQYGIDACRELIAGLRGHNIVIVSGLALGIDAAAHEAALAANLKTVAVLASGLDDESIYPPSNHTLAKEILADGGALISEFSSGYHPHKYNFPERNRIMAGLSHATLVVEAGQRSGTLITARLALDYNRDVFAVPGSIFSKHSEGTNDLISKGAMLVRSSEDILVSFGLSIDSLSQNDQIAHREHVLEDCSALERAILYELSEPLPRTELMKRVVGEPREISVAISILEMKKIIFESAGLLRKKFA